MALFENRVTFTCGREPLSRCGIAAGQDVFEVFACSRVRTLGLSIDVQVMLKFGSMAAGAWISVAALCIGQTGPVIASEGGHAAVELWPSTWRSRDWLGTSENLGDLYKSPIFRERHWAIGSELGH